MSEVLKIFHEILADKDKKESNTDKTIKIQKLVYKVLDEVMADERYREQTKIFRDLNLLTIEVRTE